MTTAASGGGSNYGNSNVASYLITSGYVNTNSAYGNGNTASYLITNGYVNTNSAYANANVTSYLPTHTGNVGVNNIIGTTPNVTLQANSYSTTYDIYGNVAFGNTAYPVQINAFGNISTGGYLFGNGAFLTGIVASGGSYSNVQVAAYLNTQGYNLYSNTNVIAYLNATGYNLYSNVNVAAYLGSLNPVKLGSGAGTTSQGTDAVAVGRDAGQQQGTESVAVGVIAGKTNQGSWGIAIGSSAGTSNQGQRAVAIGVQAAEVTQGAGAVAIGAYAGDNTQGDYAIAIGTHAGDANQPASSIILNASGSALNGTNAGLYINPVRNDLANVANVVYYNAVTNELTYAPAGSSNYSNVDVANYLPTYAGTVSASLVNTSGNVLSSGLSVFGNTRIGLAGAVSGQFHSVVGNIAQTSSGGAVYFNTTGNVLAAAVVAGAVTTTGTMAVNSATGITTNQGTFLLANATATTINMGGAATTINLGITTSATGNVFVGGQIGSNTYNLTLRANGRYNVASSINSNGGFNSPPYANQLVIGGTGTGMTANYSSTGGYIDSLTIYNSGTGYRNGDVISVPGGIAGNSFVLQNYSPNRVGAFTATALYTFGIDGNLIVPGNVSATTFVGSGALLTSLPGYAYSNVNVKAYAESMGYQNYGNVNVAALITTNGLTNYSNVNVTAYLAGNVTVGNLTVSGNLSANLLSITANTIIGTGANTYIIAGAYTSTFDNAGNVILPNVYVSGIATVVGTVNSNGGTAGTAFAVRGSGAVSNVALGYFPPIGTPAEMAIRDYSTANSTMYFDNTIGSGNVGGTFQFRSTSSYTQWAKIDRFGITLPTRPAFRVNGSAGTSQTTANVNLKSPQTVVIFNQGSYYNDTTGQFVAPVAGLYAVGLNARVSTNTSSQIAVLKNGLNSSGNIACFWETIGNAGTATHYGVNGTILLAAGDYLSANILLGTITFDGNDNWHVTYIG